MADLLPSALLADIATRVNAGQSVVEVTSGPPEGAISQVSGWLRYQTAFEWGLFEVRQPTVTLTVAVPRGGDYPNEYLFVTDTAHGCVAALRGPILLANEAPITGVAISEAVEAMYAGSPIMAATVSLSIETKEINNTGAGA